MLKLTEFPDDILEDIFHAMRDLICFPGEKSIEVDVRVDDEYGGQKQAIPLWANVITLSHVCNHWRNLMLTRPRLWTFIRITGSFTNRLMVNEMIERSGTFPLSILITQSTQRRLRLDSDPRAVFDLLGVTSVVSDYSERIHELGIVLSHEHVALALDSLSKCRVSNLDKLWLDNGQPGTERLPRARIPLFENAMPSLSVLHTHGVSIPWLPYEGLVRLDLTCTAAPPLAALLHTIAHSPLLEILSLRIPAVDIPDAEHNDLITDEQRIFLPRLRVLDLCGGVKYDAAFSVLPHLAFPPSRTHVRLSVAGGFCIALPLASACPSLAELASHVSHATLELTPHRVLLTSHAPPLTLAYDASEQSLITRETAKWLLERLCTGLRALPFPALSSLSLFAWRNQYGKQLPVDGLAALFDALPVVVRLSITLYAAHAEAVFEALKAGSMGVEDGASEGEREGHAGGRAVCPRLSELRVRWMDRPTVDDFWRVERCCYERCVKGAMLDRLETLEFPPIVFYSLKKWVKTVDVVDETM